LDAIRATFKKGFDDEALIATILYQALKGLDYIHKNGCIHRDIKAGNMLVGSNGLVKLADFGVASTLYEGEHRRVRRTFVGTPCWMAPEVMEMNPGGYDCKADIWSLGITAIELATGSAPYAKYPPMKIIYLTLTSPPPSLSCESKKFSKSFRQFVDTCLQKDTVSRPTCEALLRHPFIKTNAKKASYVAEHLYSKIAPIHSRCRKEHVDSQISLKEHEQELSDWNFASDKEGIELKDTLLTTYEPGICSRKRGRFLVSNNVPSEDDSLPTLADKLEALSVTSVHGEGLSQKGRFSLVEEENSLGDSVRNSEQKGRFHVERDGADATLKSPIISMYSHDFQQCASPLSHVDQLLLLNEMVRHQLLDLRNILAVTQDFDARQDVDKPLAGNHRSSLSLSESRP
jgi:serine/threonine protein kinase